MHTTMRSNDVWLGLPYDLFTATILQELMAGWLGVELGTYHHHVDSLHLYAQHDQGALEVATSAVEQSPMMTALAAPAEGFTEFVTAVVAGTPSTDAESPWREMAAILASYRQWNADDRHTARALAASIGGSLGSALLGWYTHLTRPAALATSPAGGAR
jgi:thymidylate synthase